MAPDHMTDSQISGYLDQDLSAAERSAVESHLDTCRPCREAVADVSRMFHSYSASTDERGGAIRKPFTLRKAITPALGLIAASIGVVWFMSREVQRLPHGPSLTRSRDLNALAQIDVVSPAGEDVQPGGKLIWRSVSADFYRLAILDDTGEPVYQAELADTSLVIPDSAHLEQGRLYFWRVDAIADGVAASSGARKLRLIR